MSAFLTWKIQDATMRMQSSPDLQDKIKWARVLNEARRALGEIPPGSTRPPCAALSLSTPNGVSSPASQVGAPIGTPLPAQGEPEAVAQAAALRDAAMRAALDRSGERDDEEEP